MVSTTNHTLLPNYKYISILAVGGGGAGGSSNTSDNINYGGLNGGGGGGGGMRYLLNLKIKDQFPSLLLPQITIGTGGFTSGTDGTSTIINGLITAYGGKGGGNATTWVAGSGGKGGAGGGLGSCWSTNGSPLTMGSVGIAFNDSESGIGGIHLQGEKGYWYEYGSDGGNYNSNLLTDIFGGTGLGGPRGINGGYSGGGGGAGYGGAAGDRNKKDLGGLPGGLGAGGGASSSSELYPEYENRAGGKGGDGLVVLYYHNKLIKDQ